ncbi:hypothetical protein HPB50_011852 [Hyalomma asiaticum]|uniref:Uncharacterized protein n=1 Tax=Hyalomma asiaticum TaxID=266040 RepID=A0ACB7T1A8_HYAAI|nr:hypothetical protein HPB50_011852 [Hyalomma asiaticum]
MTANVWLMLLLAQAAAGMVCPPHICEDTQCPPVKTCRGRLSTEGSFCGCCKVCIQQLGEGLCCHSDGGGSEDEMLPDLLRKFSSMLI